MSRVLAPSSSSLLASLLAPLLALAAACGSDDAPAADAGAPDGGVAACLTSQRLGTTFTVATPPTGSAVHPRLLFDGTAIWITYSAPPSETSNNFATWITRVGCDGTTLAEPALLSQTPQLNAVQADLARNGDDILVAWAADDGNTASSMNLQIYTRVLDLAGVPRADAVKLVTTSAGTPLVQNNWMPKVVAAPSGGGFWLAGSRVLPSIDRFNAYVQRLDADGAPVGDAIDLAPRAGAGSFTPAVAALASGALAVIWQRVPDAKGTSNFIELGRVTATGEVVDVVPGLTDDDTTTGDYASAASAGERAYVAFHGGPDDHDPETSDNVDVRLDTQPIGADRVAINGLTTDALAQVAAHPDAGGALAWVRFASRRTLMLQPFVDTASGVALAGTRVTVDGELSVGGETPALIHLHDHVYAVAWIEYIAADERYVVRLRLVDLPPSQ